MARPRIVPNESNPRCLLLFAAIGCALGFGYPLVWSALWSPITNALGTSAMGFGFIAMIVVCLVIAALPAMLCAALLASVGVRAWRALLMSVTLVLCALAGIGCWAMFRFPEFFASLPFSNRGVLVGIGVLAATVVYAAILGVIAVGLMMAAYALKRILGRRVIRQTGLLCTTCAYDLGASSIVICPECGAPFDPAVPTRSRLFHAFDRLRQRGKPLLVLVITLIIAPVIWMLITRAIPTAQFLHACPPEGSVQQLFLTDAVPGDRTMDNGWFVPDGPGAAAGFAVHRAVNPARGEPHGYIVRANLMIVSPEHPNYRLVVAGTRTIRAALDAEQFQQIIGDRSIPGSLRAAIKDRANNTGWSELQDFTGLTLSEPIDVDAKEHFRQRP